MPKPPSPGQIAGRLTFALKGHLKNVQISYLRLAAGLARFRDEKLWAALKHKSLDAWAAEELGLGHASLYHYLQVYDWAREYHPAWLARKPKGFIPQVSDAYALMWMDQRLAGSGLNAGLRAKIEALRRKALSGKMTASEFRAVRAEAIGERSPLRALLSALRTAQRRAAKVSLLPAELRTAIDKIEAEVEHRLESAKRLAMVRRVARDPVSS
jgi:hypothetical protein